MNKAVPWSIKGVDFDARTAAKEAARRAGMTLGEWLNSVIAEQAAEQGLDPEDIGEEERVNAVRSRLERLSPSNGLRRRTDRPVAPRSRFREEEAHYEDDVERAPRRAPSPMGRMRPQRSFDDYAEPAFGADALLDEAVRSFERQGAPQQRADQRCA